MHYPKQDATQTPHEATAIQQALGRVTRGETVAVDGLTITPLLDTQAGTAQYLTLQEATGSGRFSVKEVSNAGSVSILLVSNQGPSPVFLLDGEELLGAKQNRIVNLSLMVPTDCEMEIPVTCVEQGRWSHVSDEFRPIGNSLYSTARARKMSQVSESLAARRMPTSNQSEVWGDIVTKTQRLRVGSHTDAMDAIFAQRRSHLARFVSACAPVEHQVGAVFLLHGLECGIEFFEAPSTWIQLMPKVVRSWAVDAIDKQMWQATEPTRQANFVDELAAGTWQLSSSLGLGADARLMDRNVTAAGLLIVDAVVHLASFRTSEAQACVVD